jgi:hypothetical protein
MDSRKLSLFAGAAKEEPTSDELRRLRSSHVSYMEIASEAGGFSCGTCRWADPGASRCTHRRVDAPVSPSHGCCNLWAGEGVMFPPGFKPPR